MVRDSFDSFLNFKYTTVWESPELRAILRTVSPHILCVRNCYLMNRVIRGEGLIADLVPPLLANLRSLVVRFCLKCKRENIESETVCMSFAVRVFYWGTRVKYLHVVNEAS